MANRARSVQEYDTKIQLKKALKGLFLGVDILVYLPVTAASALSKTRPAKVAS